MPSLTSLCPYCFGKMQVQRLRCAECSAAVEADFQTSELLELSPAQQEFVELFVRASGSLKEMAERLGVSYPTVRGRLDRIIEALAGGRESKEARKTQILDAIEEERLRPEEGARLLKQLK